MPFTFKLSQRLARIRRVVLEVSRAAVAACEAPLTRLACSIQPQVARLVVPPANTLLKPS